MDIIEHPARKKLSHHSGRAAGVDQMGSSGQLAPAATTWLQAAVEGSETGREMSVSEEPWSSFQASAELAAAGVGRDTPEGRSLKCGQSGPWPVCATAHRAA